MTFNFDIGITQNYLLQQKIMTNLLFSESAVVRVMTSQPLYQTNCYYII